MGRKKLHKIFVKALTLIPSEEFWTKLEFHADDGERHRYCMLGALRMAASGDAEKNDIDHKVEPIIEKCIKQHFPELDEPYATQFNDAEETKFKHVRKVMVCAIAKTKPKKKAA